MEGNRSTVRLELNSEQFLCDQMASIVAAALEGGSDMLLEYLFGECSLLTWLTTAPEDVSPLPRPDDTRCAQGP